MAAASGVSSEPLLDSVADSGKGATPVAVCARVDGVEWGALEAQVASCRACGLHETRTQAVFGVGDRNADLMIIGEAPGADEDRQGKPFVGRAGQLLNAMLFAMGFQREQVFIANVLKCRPPGNRDPRPEEAAHCEPFLMRQVELVRPKVVLAVGRISAQNLLGSSDPVGRLRGRVHTFGSRGIPLVVTYHPAYLLRSPDQKSKVWQDLQSVMQLLGCGSAGS
jgi:DNA polymerase